MKYTIEFDPTQLTLVAEALKLQLSAGQMTLASIGEQAQAQTEAEKARQEKDAAAAQVGAEGVAAGQRMLAEQAEPAPEPAEG